MESDGKINNDRLRQLRERRGLSQKVLAGKLGVDMGTVSRWERSRTEIRGANLGKLCAALGTTPDVLAGEGSLPQEGDRPPEPPKGQINTTIDACCRNALALVAQRYAVKQQQILELAPLLFFIAAEQSLAQRRQQLGKLREAEDAVYEARFAHHPRHAALGTAAEVEARSIDTRDLFGRVVTEHPSVWLDEDWDESEANPFAVYLTKALDTISPPSSPVAWSPSLSPAYRICTEEASAFVGGDKAAIAAIQDGFAALHEMPREIRDSSPAERASWVHEQVRQYEIDITEIRQMLGLDPDEPIKSPPKKLEQEGGQP